VWTNEAEAALSLLKNQNNILNILNKSEKIG
jgi:hypothetical protein